MTKTQARHYFIARAKDVQKIMKDGSPWGFLCAAAFLDVLAKLVAGRDLKKTGYKSFVRDFLSKIDPRYQTFTYINGKHDLPDQIYHVFRCGIIHSFSLVPDQQAIQNGGRVRSIALCHKKESRKKRLPHLSNYSSGATRDAAVFVAEDFSRDLRKVVSLIFSQDAKQIEPSINRNIRGWLCQHPPISGGF